MGIRLHGVFLQSLLISHNGSIIALDFYMFVLDLSPNHKHTLAKCRDVVRSAYTRHITHNPQVSLLILRFRVFQGSSYWFSKVPWILMMLFKFKAFSTHWRVQLMSSSPFPVQSRGSQQSSISIPHHFLSGNGLRFPRSPYMPSFYPLASLMSHANTSHFTCDVAKYASLLSLRRLMSKLHSRLRGRFSSIIGLVTTRLTPGESEHYRHYFQVGVK